MPVRAQTHTETRRNFIFCPMQCIALDRQQVESLGAPGGAPICLSCGN